MAASRMCQGVTKSGSPMPSEMTPDRGWTISKKSRMPERGMPRTWSATKSGDGVTGEWGRCMLFRRSAFHGLIFPGINLGRDLEAFLVHDVVAKDALDLVGLEVEMGGRGQHAGEGRQLLGNEAGDFLQR